ncbi:sensor histidine kinase [Flavobacterium silvaticum]|uniref:histidine kinase n=1 Tax=Flavobacterium silvaticum TaxID=1852020 RepID=A0A972FT70_9FLAO|nr:HAMP domain-containing sensor histidine kinase [Flavobacterium silvaticum]NMH27095.1 HAMP domain-containing histidine kinase [Flavobacterium silvaticum]
MGKNIIRIVSLMAVCVVGIAFLQFFYSWQSYQVEKRTFVRNTNEAFAIAVDSSFSIRYEQIAAEFRTWISDTGYIRISTHINPTEKVTVFTMAQVHPVGKGLDQISMSLDNFRKRLDTITPEARDVFIEHMVSVARNDIKNGYVFYYTQQLGKRLDKIRFHVPLDTAIVRKQFQMQLKKRGIILDFSLNPQKSNAASFRTDKKNIAVRTNVTPQWIYATFNDSGFFVFKQLKWAILGSVALLLLTLFCFAYTLRLLLTQQKLAQIKDDFINNMTHELHTPLASLTVTAESLKKFAHDQESRNSYLDIILHQVKRLGILTSEILDAAKVGVLVNQDKKELMIANVINDVILHFPNTHIRYEKNLAGTALTGNEVELRKALCNIIDNAIKYSNKPSVEIGIKTNETAKHVFIEIADNGPGIPVAEREKVFDAFYRIGQGNRHDVKGFGLGLNYVHKVILKHNGTISVSGNPESGAVFTIKLPK